MDKELFLDVCHRIIHAGRRQKGIGTLGEKTMHAVLKHYFEGDHNRHEIRWEGFVADIASREGIIEIQTRQFDKLRRKLEAFLDTCPVTVVFPVPHIKWLCWMDMQTGEVTKKRKSPKEGRVYEILPELYKIKKLLVHPNLHFCVMLVNVEEYRYLNGWSKDKKKGSVRCDMVPMALEDEIYINSVEDYAKLLPPALLSGFSSMDYKKASGLSLKKAQTALNVLYSVGAVERIGKKGNSILYRRAANNK